MPTPFAAPRTALRALRQRVVKSIPLVVFFLVLFYCVFLFFDKHFAMIVPFVSVLFEFNHRRYLSPLSLLRLVGVGLLMCLCAFLAGQNLVLCVTLNAFILLQPMYEDSTYRAKTRLVGTLIGCGVCYLVIPLLPGLPAYLVFFSVVICGIQCATPGTWVHPIFTTTFSLSMASLTMSHTTAIWLRTAYLLAATGLVLLANRRFFPTSLPGQFRENIKELFHIQSAYLQLLADSTRQAVDYGAISTALTHFHLVRDQVLAYLNRGLEPLDRTFYDRLLHLMWRMAAQAELLIFLLRSQDNHPEDVSRIRDMALDARQRLDRLAPGLPAPRPPSPQNSGTPTWATWPPNTSPT